MNSITSSFFGRLFGNPTHIVMDHQGITLTVKNSVTVIAWHQLLAPPQFTAGWLGQSIYFETAGQHYLLSKLSYRSATQYHEFVQRCWLDTHQPRLQTLLTKVERAIAHRYLRQSTIQQMRQALNKEYQRWFPWASSNRYLGETAGLVQRLADLQQWQPRHFSACREAYIKKQLQHYQRFFDHVETNPLTAKQRRACIIDDDNNLLLAGAGTGKTSVMVGRAGYLLNSQQATHSDLLLLAYGKKAAAEMDQRLSEKLGTDKITASTFHSLGLAIITQVEGQRPTLSRFAQDERAKAKWVADYFNYLLQTQHGYLRSLVHYFNHHYYVENHDMDFASLGDYYQYLQDNEIRSLKGETVNSIATLKIANWLFSHGIEYQYGVDFPDTHGGALQGEKVDFYLPQLDIYIDYFSVDEHGQTPRYIDNQQYRQSMHDKRNLHRASQRHCIELTNAEQRNGSLLTTLAKALGALGVELKMRADAQFVESLKASGHIDTLSDIFTQLVGLYKGARLDAQGRKKLIAEALDGKQTEQALQLLTPILNAYQKQLSDNNEIDFEDMINKAINYVESGRFNSPWRYIMVDEFQDISQPRARLVKALRDNKRGCSVFAVGDDWQAIYRFSGADVRLTTNFSDYFGATTQSELDKTFRFNNRIGEVATEFIIKNPDQLRKNIASHQQLEKAAVSILQRPLVGSAKLETQQIDEISSGALDEVLTAIAAKVTQPQSVYLLARFWFQLPDKTTLACLQQQYPLLNIETHSFHASKGKESDYVVIMGLKSGKHGFPSAKVTPAIVNTLLAEQEQFPYAEERRLFYVALTRAKTRVYIIADCVDSSVFVEELIAEHDVELNEFVASTQRDMTPQHCPQCSTGRLKLRASQYGQFYACSHFPRCTHKQRACEQCGSAMTSKKHSGFKSCLNPSCHHMLPLCAQCGAEMQLRNGRNGEFWGCSNFARDKPQGCKHSVEPAKVVWPI